MKNDQLIAARRALNPRRSSIKLETVRNPDGSETFTPYLVSNSDTRGGPVTITLDTTPNDVQRLFAASLRSIPEED